ncbi:MAG TPA: hydrogenase maturation protease [Solirubrobacteraceae bacterium]|nr:hydrogenase maturation protease [Solirubrobacteraceae bacterium]
MRVLVGGLGYRFLRDESVGPYMADRLAAERREGVEVEDVSYHAVGLSQNLQEREPYDRVVLVAAVRRGREPGTVESYRWDGVLPERDEIQAYVGEAAVGLLSLDGHLIVCGALGGLPDDVRVVEVEPGDEGWGEGFSPAVEARLGEIEEAVWTSTRP